ncbi:MAG: hypothetical protein OEV06_01790 [Anaerolineae bacterium]|nr:hypothetical protein [Anaerolineae bacterium]
MSVGVLVAEGSALGTALGVTVIGDEVAIASVGAGVKAFGEFSVWSHPDTPTIKTINKKTTKLR